MHAQPEFKKGFNKRTSGTAFSEEVFSNERELKWRKLSQENEASHSFVSEEKHDLAIFGNLPTELLQYHIALVLPLNWIFVSKLYYELAMNNLHRDPRIQNEDLFMRAITLDNLHVVKIILERSAWLPKHHHMENGVVQAAKRGSVKVVQYFINNNLLTLKNPEYFYVSILKKSVRAGSYDVVEFLLHSGKVTRFSECSYSLLEIAAMQNQSNIVELLMANGVYDVYHMIFLLEKVIDSKCNISIVRILFRATQHALPSTEADLLLRRAIKNNVYDVVEYLLDEVLAFVHLGKENMSLAVGMGAEKILGKLMNDSRIVWDPSILVPKAVMDGFPKIVRMLLDDPQVDVNSIINTTLFIQALQNNDDNQNNPVFVLLEDPRINFNFYASFAAHKAIKFGSNFVAETIMNDKRFIVMDQYHYEIAMKFAGKNDKTNLIQRLESIKHIAQLDPDEIWSEPK